MKNAKDAPVGSVQKALNILTLLVFEDFAGEGISLGDLSERQEMPKSTARSMLKTMISCEYVEQLENGNYVPGKMCRRIGTLNLTDSAWHEGELLELMQNFSRRVGVESVFAVCGGGERMVVARADSEQAVKVDMARIEKRTLYEMPTGRILAAYAPQKELSDIISALGYPGSLWNDITCEEEFKTTREKIRSNGHVIMHEGNNSVASFAVAVCSENGGLIGALGSYTPLFNCPAEREKEIIAQMKETALLIGRSYDCKCNT